MADPTELLRACVTRRVVLAVPIAVGLAGCTLSPDPYIKAMKADPMYSWAPTMRVSRKVAEFPKNATLERTSISSISIWLTPTDPHLVPELLKAAQLARSHAGYPTPTISDDVSSRRNAGQVDGATCWIECSIFATYDRVHSSPGSDESPDTEIGIFLRAPYSEP